jgi:2-oxoisovalerate dehydrogenase E1 component alpha subunit
MLSIVNVQTFFLYWYCNLSNSYHFPSPYYHSITLHVLRQMPIHYGSRALNYHTVSSPLGTQLPQAVGVAYKMKLDKLAKKTNTEANMEDSSSTPQKGDSITIVYFGEGAASTTDFHCALNFAATLKVPMIFFCRNNGYAISTKISDQYASDGIVCRSRGYGMAAIRVDGNDIFAVNAATKAAREYAIQNSEPVLIEAITYRQGHHSTSDDSYQYRSVEEVSKSENTYDPIMRFEKFLTKHKWINEDDLIAINDEERKSVLKAMERAEKRPQPKLGTMFQDVYKDMPLNLLMQEKSLHRHMKKYSEKY